MVGTRRSSGSNPSSSRRKFKKRTTGSERSSRRQASKRRCVSPDDKCEDSDQDDYDYSPQARRGRKARTMTNSFEIDRKSLRKREVNYLEEEESSEDADADQMTFQTSITKKTSSSRNKSARPIEEVEEELNGKGGDAEEEIDEEELEELDDSAQSMESNKTEADGSLEVNNSLENATCVDDEVSRDTSTRIRKKKQRGSEIHNLLIAQGKDPSEVNNLSDGPNIYKSIKSKRRMRKRFFDDDDEDDERNSREEEEEEEEEEELVDDSPVVLRRSARHRHRSHHHSVAEQRAKIVEEDDDDDDEDDDEEEKEEKTERRFYYLRTRKPRSLRNHLDDVERSYRKSLARRSLRGCNRSPYKSSRDNRSDSDDPINRHQRTEDEARARCMPINMTAADLQVRNFGMEGPKIARAKTQDSSQTLDFDKSITFDSIGGHDDIIKKLKETVRFPQQYSEFFDKFNLPPQKGLLFHGLPGTGKTHLARALANECSKDGQKVAFFMVKGADILSKWFGDSERQMRLLFEKAYECRPSIIFIDEIDGIAPRRSANQESGDSNAFNSLVSSLLAQMDGMNSTDGVLVIGATNRPDAIDPALRRPGRFDREFHFTLPNKEARLEILRIHTLKWEPEVTQELLEWLADHTAGYCGADIKCLCTEAALAALRDKYPQIYSSDVKLKISVDSIRISKRHFQKAMEKITPATQRSNSSIARPLSACMRPLLEENLRLCLEKFSRVYPAIKTKSKLLRQDASDRAANEQLSLFEGELQNSLRKRRKSISATVSDSDDCNDDLPSSEEEDNFNSEYRLSELSVCRPRMLLCGNKHSGLASHLAPALLSDLEGVNVHVLGVSGAFGPQQQSLATSFDPHLSVKALVSQARRTAPSIIYMQDLEQYLELTQESVLSVLESELNSVPATTPVLLLGVCHESKVSRDVARFFPTFNREQYYVTKPTAANRSKFFEPIFMDIAKRPPHQKALRRLRKQKEVLERAEQEEQKPTPEQLVDIKNKEDHILRELRLFLRSKLEKLSGVYKYRYFRYPVDEEDAPDYRQVIKSPMAFTTMMDRIDQGYYWDTDAFMKDIELICANALEYNPEKRREDRRIRQMACSLRDYARSELESNKPYELESGCKWVIQSRKSRGIEPHTPDPPGKQQHDGNNTSMSTSVSSIRKRRFRKKSKWACGNYQKTKRRPKPVEQRNGDMIDDDDDDDDDEEEHEEHFNNNHHVDDDDEEEMFMDEDDVAQQNGDIDDSDHHHSLHEDEDTMDSRHNHRIMQDDDDDDDDGEEEKTNDVTGPNENSHNGGNMADDESSQYQQLNKRKSPTPPSVSTEVSDSNDSAVNKAALPRIDGGGDAPPVVTANHVSFEDDCKPFDGNGDVLVNGGENAEMDTTTALVNNDEEENDAVAQLLIKEESIQIPSPPPLLLDTDKLKSLHVKCVEETEEFCAEQLQQVFTRLCRIIMKHKNEFNKSYLLEDMDDFILSLRKLRDEFEEHQSTSTLATQH